MSIVVSSSEFGMRSMTMSTLKNENECAIFGSFDALEQKSSSQKGKKSKNSEKNLCKKKYKQKWPNSIHCKRKKMKHNTA